MNSESKPPDLRDQSFIFLGISWALLIVAFHLAISADGNYRGSFFSAVPEGGGLVAAILSLRAIAVWTSKIKGKISSRVVFWSVFISVLFNIFGIVAFVFQGNQHRFSDQGIFMDPLSSYPLIYIALPILGIWVGWNLARKLTGFTRWAARSGVLAFFVTPIGLFNTSNPAHLVRPAFTLLPVGGFYTVIGLEYIFACWITLFLLSLPLAIIFRDVRGK
jgi:hypothetical protein